MWRSTNEDAKSIQKRKERTHQQAFTKVEEAIDQIVVIGKNIVKLTDLLKIYVDDLSQTEFRNNQYRCDN